MLTHTEGLTIAAILAAVIAAYGIAEILAPTRLIQLQNWIGQANRWSRPNLQWKPQLWQHRVAGAIALVLAGWMGWSVISRPRAPAGAPSKVAQSPVGQVGPGWFGFCVAAALVGGGIYFLANPRVLVHWVTSGKADRAFTEEALRKGAVGARVFAAVMVLFGVGAVLLWLGAV